MATPINASGWSSLVSNPDIKFRTRDALNTYNTNPEFKEHFDRNAKEAIREFVSKYDIVD